MPQEWKCEQIIATHKKGEQMLCNNYRRITLLNTAFKILSMLTQRRLVEATKDKVEQYQNGFRKGRSTTDSIHTVKLLMGKGPTLQNRDRAALQRFLAGFR